MNKSEILQPLHGGIVLSPLVEKLAKEINSVEQADARRASLTETLVGKSKQEKIWTKVSLVFIALGALLFFLCLTAGSLAQEHKLPEYISKLDLSWLPVTAGGLICLFIAASVCSCRAADVIAQTNDELKMLQPIAETDRCKPTLEYVKVGHPRVLAWRDIVISERGQLYAFDAHIIYALNYWEKQERQRLKSQDENLEACRKLHGLSTFDPPTSSI